MEPITGNSGRYSIQIPFTQPDYDTNLQERPMDDQSSDVFEVKDSGERKKFASGMVRDVTTGKSEWHRTADGPMLKRWAVHLTRGGIKYPDVAPGKANWTLADGEEEYQRFRQSAYRHFMQWYYGDRDEDHGAAVFFNINGAEYVKEKTDASSR